MYVQSVVPATLQAANIAALQTPSGAGSLTLTAGTSASNATIQGNAVIALDVPRCVSVVGQGGVTLRNYTISGYDRYQNPMTQTMAGPNGNQTITTTKAFAYVKSITVDGGTSQAISVGTSDTIGLDMYASAYELIDVFYAGADVTANTGFTAGVATSPSTALLGDVRGTYALQSASNGTNRLTIVFFLQNTDTVTQVWGVPQV